MENNHYTPVQQAILNLLSDGKPHSREEIHGCLNDDLSSMSAIYFHISVIRGKLRSSGHGISYFRKKGNLFYYMTRTLASPYRE